MPSFATVPSSLELRKRPLKCPWACDFLVDEPFPRLFISFNAEDPQNFSPEYDRQITIRPCHHAVAEPRFTPDIRARFVRLKLTPHLPLLGKALQRQTASSRTALRQVPRTSSSSFFGTLEPLPQSFSSWSLQQLASGTRLLQNRVMDI